MTPPPFSSRASFAPGRLPAGRMAWLVFAITLSVYVATSGGSLTSTDPVVIYNLTESLVERGSIALATSAAGQRKGVDGRMYSWFGIGQSIYNIPFYLAGRTVGHLIGPGVGKPDTITKAAVGMGSTLPAAGCAALVFLFAWRLTSAPGPSLAAAFALAFGTIMWPYSKFGFNMPLAACLVLSGTYLVWRGVRGDSVARLSAGGALLGCAFLTRHESPFLFLPLYAWLLAESWPDLRRMMKHLAAASWALALAALVWMAYNAARFGHVLDTGQRIAGQPSIDMLRSPLTMFGQSITESLAGLLFAPSTSLFLYSPIVVVGIAALVLLARSDRSTALLLSAQVLLYLLFLVSAGNWPAGRAYGSRYMVPAIPLLCVAMGFWFRDTGRRARTFGAAVIAVSVLIQIPGVLVDYSKMEQEHAQQSPPAPIFERMWLWDSADLVLNTRAAIRLIPVNIRYLSGIDTPPRVTRTAAKDQKDFGQQFAFSLDFWWLYLFYLGVVSAPIALCGLLVPLAVAIGCASRLRAIVGAASAGTLR